MRIWANNANGNNSYVHLAFFPICSGLVYQLRCEFQSSQFRGECKAPLLLLMLWATSLPPRKKIEEMRHTHTHLCFLWIQLYSALSNPNPPDAAVMFTEAAEDAVSLTRLDTLGYIATVRVSEARA